jgi:hypothetical protein
VKSLLRFGVALLALFALYGLRAWFVLGGAFFGLVFVRSAYALARETRDFPAAFFIAAMGFWLLRGSYRWFAVRWHAEPPADAPAA